MFLKKIIIVAFSFLFFTSLLFPQSLVELAKKEKERRENLKKKAKVVTNIDLARSERKTALIIERFEIPVEETATEVTRLEEPALKVKTVSEMEKDEKRFRARKAEFEAKWKRAKEYVELLETKMNSLFQEYYNLADMKYRELIERQINEGYLKLPKARQEAAKAKEELEMFLAQARREGIPAGWLR